MPKTTTEIQTDIERYENMIRALEDDQGLDEYAIEERYQKGFENNARYMGNGVYSWCGMYSTDTRELFVMGVLIMEGVELEIE